MTLLPNKEFASNFLIISCFQQMTSLFFLSKVQLLGIKSYYPE